jgi:hypothetical protein
VGEIAIVENEVTVAWFLGAVENHVAWYNSNAAPNNKRLQRTGISVPLIDNLPVAQLSPGR